MNKEVPAGSKWIHVCDLQHFLSNAGLSLTDPHFGPECDEFLAYADIFRLAHSSGNPLWIRGSAVAKSAGTPRQTAETTTVHYYLSPLTSTHEAFAQLHQERLSTGGISPELIRFFAEVTRNRPDIDVYPTRRGYRRISDYPFDGLDEVRRQRLPNGVRVTEVRLQGETIGFGGVSFVDASRLKQELRSGIWARQDAARGQLVPTSNQDGFFCFQMLDSDQASLGEPERLNEARFSQLSRGSQLSQIGRGIRFNTAHPHDAAAYDNRELRRLPEDVTVTLVDILASTRPQDLSARKGPSAFNPGQFASELSAGFCHHPPTVRGLLLKTFLRPTTVRDLFPYLDRDALTTLGDDQIFQAFAFSEPIFTRTNEGRLDLSNLIMQLATPEAREMANRINETLGSAGGIICGEYQEELNWSMPDLTAYLVLPLIFSPVRLE